jgi:multiple sugar transport system permease protein
MNTKDKVRPDLPGLREADPAGLKRVRTLAYHAISWLILVVFILPLIWMASASLRQPGLPPPRSIEWLPTPLAWDNYARLFDLLPIGRYALNSLIVSTLAVPLTLVTASWAGFAMAQLSARGRERMMTFSLVVLMIPVTAVWLTRYVLFAWLGLVDSYLALLAPGIMGSSPLFILLFYWAFRRIPAELYEAARLEGAGAFVIWRRVALPLAGATLVAVSLLAFILYWSDFITPLLYLKTQSLYTLPVGLRQLQEMDRTNWPLLMAGSVVMTAPVIALFLIVQRYFLQESRLAGIYGQ